jgi:predicted acetyltransferase
MQLVKASLDPPPGLQELAIELNGGRMAFTWDNDLANGRLSIQAFTQLLVDMEAGRSLREGWVPMTTCWLVDDGGVIAGVSRIRHSLTPRLFADGGHIGYYVRAAYRGQGHGTQILALTLIEAKKLGLDRVLLTVDSDNEPSIRVIERNGGLMEDERTDEDGVRYRRYWIDLTS